MKCIEILQALVPILRDVVQVANNRIFWGLVFLYCGLWGFVGIMAFADVWFFGGGRFNNLIILLDKL